MLPECDVELLENHLREIHRQARADAVAATFSGSMPAPRRLFEQLLSAFRTAPARASAAYRPGLRVEGHLPR